MVIICATNGAKDKLMFKVIKWLVLLVVILGLAGTALVYGVLSLSMPEGE